MTSEMRTTLTLEKDVAQAAKKVVAKSGKTFKQVVNEALRMGLELMQRPAKVAPYRYKPHNMGLRPGINLGNVQELIEQIEAPDAR